MKRGIIAGSFDIIHPGYIKMFNLNIPIHFLDRSHGWSTTKYKELIYKQIDGKRSSRKEHINSN